MSDLSRIKEAKDQRAARTGNTSRQRPVKEALNNAGVYDRNACPGGWNADLWYLTLFWEQKREEYRYSGPGRPVIYTELAHIVEVSGIRDAGYTNFGNLDNLPGWAKVTRATIEYFWDWEEVAATNPEHALSYFCQIGYFDETSKFLVNKAAAKRRAAARREESE